MTESKEVEKISKKKVRLGLHWRNGWINFCTVCFIGNSFVFVSKFHEQHKTLSFGNARSTEKGFRLLDTHEEHISDRGQYHLTLHPPLGEERGVLHFRESDGGKILDEVRLDWFPVVKPFHLLTLYSPPLVETAFSTQKPSFFSPIHDTYEGSIEVKVDVFPRNITEHFPSQKSLWIQWGYSPNYLVRVSFNLLNQKVPSTILWPTGLFDIK